MMRELVIIENQIRIIYRENTIIKSIHGSDRITVKIREKRGRAEVVCFILFPREFFYFILFLVFFLILKLLQCNILQWEKKVIFSI